MEKENILSSIKGGLIVSCQALPGEPLYMPDDSIMYLMARAAKRAGAAAIRTNGVRDVIAIKEETNLPVIGIIKINYPGYESYITPTLKEIEALQKAGADIIATDCTSRTRGDSLTAVEYIQKIKTEFPDIILMADISNYEEGINAWQAGTDLVGTTMSGYTADSPKQTDPDYNLVTRLASAHIPVIGEGRIHYPDQAKKVLECGAYAIVVGGAITRPLEITERFINAIKK